MLMNREPELDGGAPERLVALVIVGLDRVIGRDGGEHDASNGVMAPCPSHFCDGGVHIVRKQLNEPSPL
jgi:hypothetical protein